MRRTNETAWSGKTALRRWRLAERAQRKDGICEVMSWLPSRGWSRERKCPKRGQEMNGEEGEPPFPGTGGWKRIGGQ